MQASSVPAMIKYYCLNFLSNPKHTTKKCMKISLKQMTLN